MLVASSRVGPGGERPLDPECRATQLERSLRIVHGKGEGVLSGAIAKLLEESFLVASYGTARPEEGGWGVTTVEMAGQSKSSGGVS